MANFAFMFLLAMPKGQNTTTKKTDFLIVSVWKKR